jgi:hypothetical protein
VDEAHPEHNVTALLGGGLSERIRHGADDVPVESRRAPVAPAAGGEQARLAGATQIEIDAGQVRFLVPFAGRWPSEDWLRAFRQAQRSWPSRLAEPLLDEGRGLQSGPLPAAEIDDYVHALKEQVAAANRIYAEEIEPELRRRREDAIRREQEERRLQAEVEAKLKYLLG